MPVPVTIAAIFPLNQTLLRLQKEHLCFDTPPQLAEIYRDKDCILWKQICNTSPLIIHGSTFPMYDLDSI